MNSKHETSQEKQNRFSCMVGFNVDNWDCYSDCAFWKQGICTNFETQNTNKGEVKMEQNKRYVKRLVQKISLSDMQVSGIVVNALLDKGYELETEMVVDADYRPAGETLTIYKRESVLTGPY